MTARNVRVSAFRAAFGRYIVYIEPGVRPGCIGRVPGAPLAYIVLCSATPQAIFEILDRKKLVIEKTWNN